MNRLYFYKLVNDSGAAPCIQDGLLSLAICKPMIRGTAEVGDLVFGFAAKSLYADNRLIYVAQVTEVLAGGAYYEDARFAGRRDRIYERRGATFARRPGALYHDRPGDLEHDIGRPPAFERGRVLVSSDFRYLGSTGSDGYKRAYPRLRKAIEALKQGHRVNHGDELNQELLDLWNLTWRETGRTPDVAGARGPYCGSRSAPEEAQRHAVTSRNTRRC